MTRTTAIALYMGSYCSSIIGIGLACFGGGLVLFGIGYVGCTVSMCRQVRREG